MINRRKKVIYLAIISATVSLYGISAEADESLGTVTGTATASNDFFGSSPNVNTGETPKSDIQRIQKFNKKSHQSGDPDHPGAI
ncbi:hypothetical protein [Acidithiobacillus sp.]|uniref:hypothetical protein n=1 Tax=Acidithiobacillus sp. TaxID=1872118 RepID=UPI0026324992|nr:hypothetical protein [Acidithiobacillus sp.]MDD2750392.1 hypothetical protein [Acidithiobacillus sp.]MDD5278979.1 hypothetical protein [Acidithiobacillus sp.]